MENLTNDIKELFKTHSYEEVKQFVSRLAIHVDEFVFDQAWEEFKQENKI